MMLGRLAASVAALFAAAAAFAFSPSDDPPPEITVGVLSYGTAQWEMKVIKDNDLDRKAGVELTVRPLSGSQAGDVALLAGDVDVILTDFVWVASQRAQGNMITNVPHSLAVGGLLVRPDSGIGSVEDLPGHTLGVAGGPLDKSWIVLQAYFQQRTGEELLGKVDTRFGAPPMIAEVLGEGGLDAALNFWHYNARAKSEGMTEVVSVAAMMEEMGISTQPPLLGWAFSETTADEKSDAVRGFLDASFAAKEMLLEDDAAWEDLRELMNAETEAMFEQLREDYRDGIVTRYDAAVRDAAAQSFAIMAEYGGAELVGDRSTLPEGTFWNGYSR
jgi:NitT/TauT family transport system substrate-binding protein